VATLKADSGLYRLIADCPAILLADYSRDDRKVTLPAGPSSALRRTRELLPNIQAWHLTASPRTGNGIASRPLC
jgi:hypothetical protein